MALDKIQPSATYDILRSVSLQLRENESIKLVFLVGEGIVKSCLVAAKII